MDPTVTILIPQRDRWELTLAAIASLRRTDKVLWPVFVIDDGSTQPGVEQVFGGLPGVMLLQQPARGVTAAWMWGLQHVMAGRVILLNNDVLCHGPWVEKLIAPLDQPGVRITGCQWRTERHFPPGRPTWPLHRFVAGWAWSFDVQWCRQLHGFRTALELYWSDTDFQLRAVESAGVDCLQVVEGLPLQHLGHATTHHRGDRSQRWHRDRAEFARLWRTEPLLPNRCNSAS